MRLLLRIHEHVSLIALAVLLFHPIAALQEGITIRVCQNKDCCKRYQASTDLVRTFQDLLPPQCRSTGTANVVWVESTGCLSHCGHGPNVVIQQRGGDEEVHNGVTDPTSAAAILPVQPHPTLLAAVTVMEKAQKATEVSQKLHLLDSVIRKLDSIDSLTESAANAHARTLRAQVHLDAGQWENAKEDVQQAIAISAKQQQTPLPTNTWRILADAEEASGNVPAAIAALRQWAQLDPSFSAKVSKEVRRLSSSTA